MTNRTLEVSAAGRQQSEIRRLRGLYIVFSSFVFAFSLLLGLLDIVINLDVYGDMAPRFAPIIGALLLLVVLWIGLVLNNRHELAAAGLLATAIVSSVLFIDADGITAVFAVITAAVLASTPVYLFTLVFQFGLFAAFFVSNLQAGAFNVDDAIGTLPGLLTTVLISIAVRYFIRRLQRSAQNAERASQLLRTSATIGTAVTQISDLNPLFDRVISLIQEQFGYYHVQVFLISPGGDQAVLIASTGDIGARLLARRHQLAVGSQSVIGQVTLRGEVVVARDTDRDEVHYRNELLINTRSEVALPIRDGNTIVGALDVQSVQANAFDSDDVQALQLIADFLGGAVRNALQYEDQVRISEENAKLLRDAEENLRTIQRLNRELTRSTWQEFAEREQQVAGVRVEAEQVGELYEWTQALEKATTERRTVTESAGDHSVVAVPLTLRGEVIGAIEVEGGTENDPATINMIEEVAQRLAISLENARLYEESREATAQEQFISTLSARYQSTSSVDELLRVTLLELSETLGAQGGSIRLGKLEEQDSRSVTTNGAAAQ